MNRKQRRAAAKLEPRSQISPATTAVADLIATGLKLQQSGKLAEAETYYQRVLAIQPGHAEALHLLGLIAYQSKRYDAAVELIGQAIEKNRQAPIYLANLGVVLVEQEKYEEALSCYDKAVALKPDYVTAHFNRAVALSKLKRFDESITSYRKALLLKPDYLEALLGQSAALIDMGRHEEALTCYDKALSFSPNNAEIHSKRGALLYKLDRLDDALAGYDKALLLKPDYLEAVYARATVLIALKRYDEALAAYAEVLRIRPDYLEALDTQSAILGELGRYEEALACCDKALALKPNHPHAYNNRGTVLGKIKKYEEALASYDQALALKPDFVEALNNRANALQKMGLFDEALSNYDKALKIKPNQAIVINNKGKVLKELGRHEEALACHDEALKLNPNYVDALSDRGVVLTDLKRLDEALASYEKALTLEPNHANAHWNDSLLQLLLGNCEVGWAKGEWRWKAPVLNLPTFDFEQPYWLGEESLKGKRILIHNEQGLGDAIQFARYIPMLAAQGASVILQVQQPLHPLMSDLAGVSHCIGKMDQLPEFDFHCSINSLPLALKTRLETIPNATPYLSLPAQSPDWEAKLGPRIRPRIGLAWSGNLRPNPNRSIPLRALIPLLELNVTFVSLQKEVRPNDEIVLNQRSDILNFGPSLNSFADTASLMMHLDLVISIDTSVAHLAGALGLPVWVMVLYSPDWRWFLDREDSPWYPTARIFRQSEDRKWTSVVEHVRQALSEFLEKQKLAG